MSEQTGAYKSSPFKCEFPNCWDHKPHAHSSKAWEEMCDNLIAENEALKKEREESEVGTHYYHDEPITTSRFCRMVERAERAEAKLSLYTSWQPSDPGTKEAMEWCADGSPLWGDDVIDPRYFKHTKALRDALTAAMVRLEESEKDRDEWKAAAAGRTVSCVCGGATNELAELRRRMENARKLEDDDVKWVVNDLAEIGVEVHDQVFFLYKGESYRGGERYRRVFKREFGECQHPHDWPPNGSGNTYVGYRGEDESEWASIRRLASPPPPAPVESKPKEGATDGKRWCGAVAPTPCYWEELCPRCRADYEAALAAARKEIR